MTESPAVLKAGNRDSRLAIGQAATALENLSKLFPTLDWQQINMSSPGDRDRKMDLRLSPVDFFSRDLDEAVIGGELDCAIHSAKDLIYPLREELDWVWLPWKESREDVLICREACTTEDLNKNSLIGVSSERREDYCKTYFPDLKRASIRGNIEQRLEQLDRGDFDLIIMAKAALDRLGLSSRITRVIPLEEMTPPAAQGILAMTFRKDDIRFQTIRSLFVRTVRFIGSGPGHSSLCTSRGIQALKNCDVCFYDSLLDPQLLKYVEGESIYTGKRSGRHSYKQEEITAMISEHARRGLKVARLKGGDPGIFGRLTEEVTELEALKIPYEVIPGVSSLNAATTGTGMLLTRRSVSRGYTALSSRVKDGGIADTGIEARSKLPIVYFMSLKASKTVIDSLFDEGRKPDEAAAVVYDAGSPEQKIINGTLSTIAELIIKEGYSRPGLLIVGEITKYAFNRELGALNGKRVLISCSERLMEKSVEICESLGGRALNCSLISLKRTLQSVDIISYDWIVLTSPAAIHFFMELLKKQKTDLRSIPRIMVCGTPSADCLGEYGLIPDLCPPASFSADDLIKAATPLIGKGDKVLRLRSESAGTKITDALRVCGADVTDNVLYTNMRCPHPEKCPEFDIAFFASSSAVDAFISHWGTESLKDKIVTVIGKPTAETLKSYGNFDMIMAEKATIPSSLMTLAQELTNRKLKEYL
jgi:uroporphyrinogen III methyltransferase / synthase